MSDCSKCKEYEKLIQELYEVFTDEEPSDSEYSQNLQDAVTSLIQSAEDLMTFKERESKEEFDEDEYLESYLVELERWKILLTKEELYDLQLDEENFGFCLEIPGQGCTSSEVDELIGVQHWLLLKARNKYRENASTQALQEWRAEISNCTPSEKDLFEMENDL